MKVVVVGGTGLVGSKLVRGLTTNGVKAVAASPESGVDSVTGEGLKEVLAGAQVLVDVSNSPSFADDDVMALFTTSTENLIEAAKEAGVENYVALSVVGGDRLPASGYLRAKVAQERLIDDSGVPFSIVHATQFFEFVGGIADSATTGSVVRLPDAGIRPIAADEVAAALGKTAVGKPTGAVVEIGGPEVFGLAEWVRTGLAFRNDPRAVVVDPTSRYYGALLAQDSLLPAAGFRAAKIRFADWLPANPPPAR